MIQTRLGLLAETVQAEIRQILKSRSPAEFVPQSSLVAVILLGVPLLLLGFAAVITYLGNLQGKTLLTLAQFPEYVLLYVSALALALVFLMALINFIRKAGREGYLLTSLGLVKISGQQLQIHPFASIEKMEIEQVGTTVQFDANTGQWSAPTVPGSIDYKISSKRHTLAVIFKDTFIREVLNFRNLEQAQNFALKFVEKSGASTVIQIPEKQPFIGPVFKWLWLTLFSLAIAFTLTRFVLFPLQKSTVLNKVSAEIFAGRQPLENNLTDTVSTLEDYCRLLPEGEYIRMVKARLIAKHRETVEEVRRKIVELGDTSYKYDFMTKLRNYLYYNPGDAMAQKELDLIDQERFEEHRALFGK